MKAQLAKDTLQRVFVKLMFQCWHAPESLIAPRKARIVGSPLTHTAASKIILQHSIILAKVLLFARSCF
jgi:hypothetical protein